MLASPDTTLQHTLQHVFFKYGAEFNLKEDVQQYLKTKPFTRRHESARTVDQKVGRS